jgi:hypothetical protein
MKLDLLSYVWVQLTDEGLAAFDERDRAYLSDKMKCNGWYQFTLGDLIRNFGSVTHVGKGTPFKENLVHFDQPF